MSKAIIINCLREGKPIVNMIICMDKDLSDKITKINFVQDNMLPPNVSTRITDACWKVLKPLYPLNVSNEYEISDVECEESTIIRKYHGEFENNYSVFYSAFKKEIEYIITERPLKPWLKVNAFCEDGEWKIKIWVNCEKLIKIGLGIPCETEINKEPIIRKLISIGYTLEETQQAEDIIIERS